jgi:hypothetical protein
MRSSGRIVLNSYGKDCVAMRYGKLVNSRTRIVPSGVRLESVRLWGSSPLCEAHSEKIGMDSSLGNERNLSEVCSVTQKRVIPMGQHRVSADLFEEKIFH